MIGLVIALIVVVVVLALGLLALWRARGPTRVPAAPPSAAVVERRATVVLDLAGADPSSPAARRMVHETGARIFASLPDTEEVEVRTRDGAMLGHATYSVAEPRVISIPAFLYEPHLTRHPGPDLTGHMSEDEPLAAPPREGPLLLRPSFSEAQPRVPRPIAEGFDLPAGVRSRLRDPNDATDLVRAILEAAELTVQRERDLLRVGDLAILVVRARDLGTISHGALNAAYLRISATGAARGLVVCLGSVDPDDVRRREMLAPDVLHTGFQGVQRMADAVALCADPLRFALAPALAPATAGPS